MRCGKFPAMHEIGEILLQFQCFEGKFPEMGGTGNFVVANREFIRPNREFVFPDRFHGDDLPASVIGLDANVPSKWTLASGPLVGRHPGSGSLIIRGISM
jgi:hypothetical protein